MARPHRPGRKKVEQKPCGVSLTHHARTGITGHLARTAALLGQVTIWADQPAWEKFSHLYRPLIHAYALRSGLTPDAPTAAYPLKIVSEKVSCFSPDSPSMDVRRNFLRRLLREQDWQRLPADLGYRADDLCARWGVSGATLWRAFQDEFHVAPQRLFNEFCDLKARELARCGVRKKEIVQLLGYKHAAHLSRRLRQDGRHALLLLLNDAARSPGDIHNSVRRS